MTRQKKTDAPAHTVPASCNAPETRAAMRGTIDNLLVEERVFRPLPRIAAEATVNPQDILAARKHADADWKGFWEEAADELQWFRKWETVVDETNAPFYRWFSGARCNIVHNALDRHIETVNKNRLALIWEGEPGDTRKLTYFELYREVNRFANVLRGLGVKKGERVLIYMPSLPETVIAMLATAKIGAVHSVVFAGFSSGALADRIEDAQPRVIVTVDGFYRNGRVIALKPLVDEALQHCHSLVEAVVVVHRAHLDVAMHDDRDRWWHDVMLHQPTEALTEVVEANDPLFMLYTSGTTGKPKGIVHSHGGYMVGVHRTLNWVFDLKPTDIFWCTADPGWITGHSYVIYGPLMAGTTTLLYEGHPLYPEAGRLWSMVERWGVTILYTVPTLIRMLMRFGTQYPAGHDLTTLRLLGTVGEPISPEAWVWFYKNIGRGQCPLLDTWWQTETGMIMISPLPVSLLKPGSVTKPMPGIDVDVVDEQGNSLPPRTGGYLVIKRPWPAMMSTVFNDHAAYVDMYWSQFPGWYFPGDVARKDDDGYIWIQGRADDVIMIAGHRVGTAELEAALSSHPAVAECGVIGVPDEIRGEVAKAFVMLHDDLPPFGGYVQADDMENELMEHVRRELGPVAVLKAVEFRKELPKNRSGKIMRRILRAEEFGEDVGDTSTLEEGPFCLR
jgi:acetyl-CoA synthetase